MRRFLLQVMVGAIGLFAVSAHAQRPRPPEAVGTGTVSVLTDGIADPNGAAALAINQLGDQPSQIANIRVLPIAGRGAAPNVRDLLYLPGVDLAILNSDILTFLDQIRQFPDARRRIRLVTHLFDQKVYLLVRKEIATIEGLRGRKLAILSRNGGGHTTATTLFGLLKIDVALEPLGGRDAILDGATLRGFDGALLLTGELARVRLSSEARQELRALPITLAPALQTTYRRAVIEAQELASLADAAQVETVMVSTLLAVLNKVPSRRRSANVAHFMRGLFSVLPALRQQHLGSIWRQADINAQIPGWTRHAAARPSRVLSQAQLAELAAVAPPQSALAAATKSAPAVVHKSKVRVLAIESAPLADEHLSDGGLIMALLSASLSKARPGDAAGSDIDVRWAKAELPPIRALLSDPTIDISLPWEGADCERPNDLVQASAVLCDNALYSDPIVQVVVGLFTTSGSPFTFDTDEGIFGKTICIPLNQDVSALNGNGRNWVSEKRVTVVRQSTLLDCISMVQRLEADAFVANDLEGRYVLNRLGLAQLFRMVERPLGTRGVHAIVSRQHPRASYLIDGLNLGLRQMKQNDAYGSIVRQHLMKLWEVRASTP